MPFVGGIKPLTATNFLPPTSSKAFFWCRVKADKSQTVIATLSLFRKKTRSFIVALKSNHKFKHRAIGSDKLQDAGQQKLPLKLIPNRLPRFKQLKYLPRFLSPKEKLATLILLGVIFLDLAFMAGRFYINHREIVPASGGEYIEAMVGAPNLINPVIGVTADIDKDLTKLVYSGLLKYNKEHKLIPDIASNYAISEDQKTYTFYLK